VITTVEGLTALWMTVPEPPEEGLALDRRLALDYGLPRRPWNRTDEWRLTGRALDPGWPDYRFVWSSRTHGKDARGYAEAVAGSEYFARAMTDIKIDHRVIFTSGWEAIE
jgi:hypothetical protein